MISFWYQTNGASSTIVNCSDANIERLDNLAFSMKSEGELIPSPLAHLLLEGNRIVAISDLVFRPLVNLVELRLERNRIVSIAKGAFKSLTALTTLDISNNQLVEIHFDLSANVELDMLSLDENRNLTLISGDGMLTWYNGNDSVTASTETNGGEGKTKGRRRVLSLKGVRLECDCRLIWMALKSRRDVVVIFSPEGVCLQRSMLPNVTYDCIINKV